jgi:transcriptional regulator with XRE-family HTH domain
VPRRIVAADPNFGPGLKELREQRRLSLRRLGQQVHCSHGYLWDLEAGNKRPSVSVAALLDAALGADGQLSAMVYEVSADSGELSTVNYSHGDPLPPGLEFAPDRRLGVDVAADLWRGDMQRRHLLRGTGFSAAAFMAPAMRWLTSSLDERPSGHGERLVGEPDVEPDVEMVRRITAAYRTLDNQYGGGRPGEDAPALRAAGSATGGAGAPGAAVATARGGHRPGPGRPGRRRAGRRAG